MDDLLKKTYDSIQSTWMRGTMISALRNSAQHNAPDSHSTSAPQSSTTVSRGSQRVPGNANASAVNSIAGSDLKQTVTAMSDMVERHSQNFPVHKPLKALPVQEVVLLTGATGVLGATLLAFLIPVPEVARIYVVNRRSPAGVPLLRRQKEALTEAGFDDEMVHSPKVVLLETDLPKERLGLSDELYEEIRTSVTHIFHNAYLVNFNVPLAAFEPNVRTLRHLVDLTLSSPHSTPPRLLFVSTAGVLTRSGDLLGPAKEELVPAEHATSGGYAESKWVCERILDNAAHQTPLRPILVRVAQISGGCNGAWNAHDWVPAMIRSGTYLGCLPALDQDIGWIPADAVALAMIEMRDSKFMIHHLEHPRPVLWNTILQAVSNAIHVPLVPYAEWLALLEKSGSTIKTPADLEEMKRKNPAWTLIGLFRNVQSSGPRIPWRRSVGQVVLDMSNSLSTASALSEENLPPLNGEDAVKWLHFWKRIGILDWQIHPNL